MTYISSLLLTSLSAHVYTTESLQCLYLSACTPPTRGSRFVHSLFCNTGGFISSVFGKEASLLPGSGYFCMSWQQGEQAVCSPLWPLTNYADSYCFSQDTFYHLPGYQEPSMGKLPSQVSWGIEAVCDDPDTFFAMSTPRNLKLSLYLCCLSLLFFFFLKRNNQFALRRGI